jgi:hypothetical protein
MVKDLRGCCCCCDFYRGATRGGGVGPSLARRAAVNLFWGGFLLKVLHYLHWDVHRGGRGGLRGGKWVFLGLKMAKVKDSEVLISAVMMMLVFFDEGLNVNRFGAAESGEGVKNFFELFFTVLHYLHCSSLEAGLFHYKFERSV